GKNRQVRHRSHFLSHGRYCLRSADGLVSLSSTRNLQEETCKRPQVYALPSRDLGLDSALADRKSLLQDPSLIPGAIMLRHGRAFEGGGGSVISRGRH